MVIDIGKMREDYEENENDFELLPDGEYPCFVYDLEGDYSSQKKTPQITATLKVANGEHKGRQLWHTVYLTPKAWWSVEAFFEAVGYDPDELPDTVETPHEVVAECKEEICGSKLIATVGRRKGTGEYSDREFQDIKKVKVPDEDFEVEGGNEDLGDVPF